MVDGDAAVADAGRDDGHAADAAVVAVAAAAIEEDARAKERSRRSGGHPGVNAAAEPGARGTVPSRISKSTPIYTEVVREGQEIIVQISKDPIGTKGARCTSHISLPGRYVVYLPTVDHVGVSKRIGSDKERARLRESIEGMKPPSGGLIVRTGAEELTKKQLKTDVAYLVRLWGEIAKKREGGEGADGALERARRRVLKTARDLFTDEIDQMVIDDKEVEVRPRLSLRRDVHAGAHQGHRPLHRRRADLRRLRNRGRDRPRALTQGAAALGRLPHHRPGRGPRRRST